ncbi:hypothetical protein [Jatrophihabitans endophyticus]|uniref:hypothetical protein n=1 Tax=Jatrophihabitans endophyticus TaxID=1206085 RepID=UPI0019EBDAA2|nr:hypothetical protein [Jatrophihabitans endophyticus]MBE7188664.1 hypothetical protein [Jatrophihabitans endophyticus]
MTWSSALLLLLLMASVASLGLGVRAGARARTTLGVRQRFATPAFVGIGTFCAALSGAGFHPFGGRVAGRGLTPDFRACSAWWMELPVHRRALSGDYRSAQYCHAQAVDALAPVVATALAIGLTASALAAAAVAWRERRFDAVQRALSDG